MADGDAMARLEKAVQHRIAGEYDEALVLLTTILAELPNNADAHHEKGLIHSFRVDMDESIEHLEKAVALSPKTVKYILDLAKTHTMYGDFDKAKPLFHQVLEMDPFNEDATNNLQYL